MMDGDRFWRRVVIGKQSECWLWRLKPDADGYGRFKVDGKNLGAHRVAWTLHNAADVPVGSIVMHKCDNPRCCNPHHLRLGTQAENIADRVSKGRSAHGRKPRATGEIPRTRIPLEVTTEDKAAALIKFLTDKKRLRNQEFERFILAEREGFEPSSRENPRTGFRVP